MGIWQKRQNDQIKVTPTQVHELMGHPVIHFIFCRFARAAEGYADLEGANNSDSKSLVERES